MDGIKTFEEIINIFPNSESIVISYDSEKDGFINIDIDGVDGYHDHEMENGVRFSVIYKGVSIFFVDLKEFLLKNNKPETWKK